MNLKKLAKCSLAIALIFGSVGAVAGCNKDNETAEKTEQEQTYNLYVQYMNAKGDKPLTYEQWLASIKGDKGEDGISPQVRINQTTNYWEISTDNGVTWTSTGVKATGAEGEKGDPGDDAIAPQVRINQTTNYWEISTDSGVTWTSTGVKATGAEGEKGDPGNDAIAPQVRINEDNYWEVSTDDGKTWVSTGVKATGNDATYDTYTITFDYGSAKDLFYGIDGGFIIETPETINIKSTEWVENLPEIKREYSNTYGKSFLGWFISSNNTVGKKIENFDFIGGDVTLVARFDVNNNAPSGLYDNGKYISTWNELIDEYPNLVVDAEIVANQDGRSHLSGFLGGELVIDSSITSIGDSAFSNSGLSNIILPNTITNIGVSAFYRSNITSIIIPEGVEEIKATTFSGTNLENINFPSTLKTIGEAAFLSTKLSNIKLNNGLVTIEESAFQNCDYLERVELPHTVTHIGDSVFYACDNLIHISLPNGLLHIGERVFENANNLSYYYLNGDCYLGNEYNNYLMLVSVGDPLIENYKMNPNTKFIYSSVFDEFENLNSIELSENLLQISYAAFSGCYNLKQIIIPKSLEYIERYAFSYCHNLKAIYYEGTEEEWNNINVDEYSNDEFLNATKYFYSETEPTEEGNYWHYDTDRTTPVVWDNEK